MDTEPPKARVLVSDARRGAAVASIRALARSGYNVIAADSDPRSPGLASRYASQRVVYACPKKNPRQFVDDILAAVERYQIDLILPVTEQVVLPLEAERERMEKACLVPWAPVESVATVRDKNLTFQLAEKLHVPYPRTRLVHTVDEALNASAGLGWPLVLKPKSSHTLDQSDQVRVWSVDYARDDEDLREKMAAFEGKCPVLLQEYFQGAGVGVEVLVHEGKPICAFQHRRLREVPLTGGASSLRRSEPLDPDLYAHTLALMQALNWTGLAMAEFKQNEQGESRLMEINGRMWGSLPVAVAAGVNFPVRFCELVLHGPRAKSHPVSTDYQIGVHVQNFQKELSWIIKVLRGSTNHAFLKLPRRREALRAIVDLLNPTYRFDILSLRDPMPGVKIFSNLCRDTLFALASRVGLSIRRRATTDHEAKTSSAVDRPRPPRLQRRPHHSESRVE
ncbi:MAG: ATP-grasp domain-containing protein [Candidatus Paceibacterota bacterium]